MIVQKPCPDCGDPYEVALDTSQPPEFVSVYRDLAVYCDTCVGARVKAMEREKLIDALRHRFDGLRRHGLVTSRIRETSFARSNPDVEAINPDAWKSARECPESQNIYIWGAVGVGKTYMALCALREAFVGGSSVAEVTARRFTQETDRFESQHSLLPHWCRIGVLLIDDLDKTLWTYRSINALWELLDRRSSERLRTIVTANCDLGDLARILEAKAKDGDYSNASMARAALDRLKPMTVIQMKGRSLR
jgi:DNA replication protein DnaC